MIQLAEPIIISRIHSVLPKKLTHVKEEIRIKFIKKSVELHRQNNKIGTIDFNRSSYYNGEVTIVHSDSDSETLICDIVGQIMCQPVFSNISRNENVYFYRFINIFRSMMNRDEWTLTEKYLLSHHDTVLVENIKQYVDYRTKMDKMDKLLLDKHIKSKYFIDLDFEIPLFLDDSVVEKIKANNAQRGLIDLNDINPALTSWLNSKGMRPTMSEFFYKDPYDEQVIHTDGKPGDKGKLNWVFGQDENSIMHWYNIKDIDQPKEIGMGTYGPHALWSEDEIEYVGGWKIKGTPTLVNHGTPHKMVNGGVKRLCISLIVRDKDNNQPTWAKWLEMLADPPKRISA